jgi:hypothetical protein
VIEPTHEAQARITSDGGTGLVWGSVQSAAEVDLECFLEPLSSQADADRFGVDLERRYRIHVDLEDEEKIPQGTILRARPLGGSTWTYYRVEKPPVRHDAGDEADHAEAAMERLEKYAEWA